MENQERAATSQNNIQEPPQDAKIEVQVERFPVTKAKLSKEAWDSGEGVEVQVERFPVAKAKFSKEAWDSGEGGGEGEG